MGCNCKGRRQAGDGPMTGATTQKAIDQASQRRAAAIDKAKRKLTKTG